MSAGDGSPWQERAARAPWPVTWAQGAIAVTTPRNWFPAAFFAGLAILYARWTPRQRRRLGTLAQELGRDG